MVSICKILPENNVPYFSKGNVQLHHVLLDVLSQVGEVDLFISSFTISEEFIRKLHKLKLTGQIKSLKLLIDLRSSKKTLHLSYFLSQVADEVYLANNHSKLMLIKSSDYSISIITSQNQTRGNRYEAGIISTQKSIYDFYFNSINDELPKFLSIGNIFRGNTSEG